MGTILFTKVKNILETYKIVEHLSRKKFLCQFVSALIKVQSVQFSKLSTALNDEVKEDSNERRIQAFFKDVEIDYEQVALLLILFIPKGKVRLCLDRTEWDYGKCQVNFLVLTACCKGKSIPLYFELLDNKSGNSNYIQRIEILEKCIASLGKKRILALIMDREFIGNNWLEFLNREQIGFCVRVPSNHHVTLRNQQSMSIETLMKDRMERYYEKVIVDGVRVNVALIRLRCGEILYIIGSFSAKTLANIYRKRWCIEVFFQCIKERGFDLEASQLKCLKKWKKLFALVVIAYTLSLATGWELEKKKKKRKLKKHGYPAKSTFRIGLDCIRQVLQGKMKENLSWLLNLIDKLLEESHTQLPKKGITKKIIG